MGPLLCFLFLYIALIDGKNINIPVDPDYMPQLIKASSDCIASTGVKENILNRLIEWQLDNNEPTKKLLFCFGTALRSIDKKGHIIIEAAEKMTIPKKRKTLTDAIKHCNGLEGSDKYDTLYKIVSCIRDEQLLFLRV